MVIIQIGIVHRDIPGGFYSAAECHDHICGKIFIYRYTVLGSIADRIVFQIISQRPGDRILFCQGSAVFCLLNCHLSIVGIGKPVNAEWDPKLPAGSGILMKKRIYIVLPVSSTEHGKRNTGIFHLIPINISLVPGNINPDQSHKNPPF